MSEKPISNGCFREIRIIANDLVVSTYPIKSQDLFVPLPQNVHGDKIKVYDGSSEPRAYSIGRESDDLIAFKQDTDENQTNQEATSPSPLEQVIIQTESRRDSRRTDLADGTPRFNQLSSTPEAIKYSAKSGNFVSGKSGNNMFQFNAQSTVSRGSHYRASLDTQKATKFQNMDLPIIPQEFSREELVNSNQCTISILTHLSLSSNTRLSIQLVLSEPYAETFQGFLHVKKM